MAIPFIAIQGYHTLLDSRAGKFVDEPTRSDPGWRALVDPTPVVALVEMDREKLTGLAFLVHHSGVQSGGTVVLVPGSLDVDGQLLSERSPDDAVIAVSALLRLEVTRTDLLDTEGWSSVLGSETYVVESPDPVLDDDGNPLFDVGAVEVTAANAAAFLGRPAPGAVPVSVQFRRQQFWKTLVSAPPTSEAPLAAELRAMDGTTSQVIDLPVTQLEPVALPDAEAIESMTRDIVAFPAGSVPGERLQVRILDRTGTADLEGIAAAVAARGSEVIEIGNAVEFDGGLTQVIAPAAVYAGDGLLPPDLNDLSLAVGADTVLVDNNLTEDFVVTVVIGVDFDLANLS